MRADTFSHQPHGQGESVNMIKQYVHVETSVKLQDEFLCSIVLCSWQVTFITTIIEQVIHTPKQLDSEFSLKFFFPKKSEMIFISPVFSYSFFLKKQFKD